MIASIRALLAPEHSNTSSTEEQRPTTPNFRWPTPPYAAFPSDIEQTEAEDCEFSSRPGRNVSGKLIFFLPEENSFEFQLPRSRTTQTIHFDEIRILRLSRPLLIRRESGLNGLQGDLSFTSGERHFVLEFTDDQEMEGHTLGVVNEPFGLFQVRAVTN